jgi:Putative adhesin
MKLLFKHLIASRWASICMALLSTAAFANTVYAEDYAKSYSVSNRAIVHVETNDGSVSITTSDTKQVEFHVAYQGYELNKSLTIESHQQGDEIELSASIPHLWHFSLGTIRRLHIEVRMPKDGDLRVKTGDGSIKAGGLSGNIDLNSGDGNLSVNSLKGVVRLRTGDGSIEGSDLDGSCDAVSGDGHIRLVGRFDVLRAKSGDGRIDVGALHGSKLDSGWSIGSGDGSIEVALANDLPVDIDASTGDGNISSDIPITVEGIISKSRVRGKMNGGGQTLNIHTGDGSIHLKQA